MNRSGLYDDQNLQWEGSIQAIFRRHFPTVEQANIATVAEHLAMLVDVEAWLVEHPVVRAQPWKFYLYGEDLALFEEWLEDDPENNITPFNQWCVDHED